MGSKVPVTQNVAGTLAQMRDHLPERADGVATDAAEYLIRINGVMRSIALLGVSAYRPFINVSELENFKPDLNDIQHNDRIILFGEITPGDKAARVMKWDKDATGVTDFTAGLVRPLFKQDQTVWDINGGWRTDFIFKAIIDNADGIILAIDDADRSSFANPVAHRGRRLSDHYIVEAHDLDHPPVAPSLGDAYLLGPVLPQAEGDWGGAWAGFPVNAIVWYAGGNAWVAESPRDGATLLNKKLGAHYEWSNAATEWLFLQARNNDRYKLPNTLARPDIAGKTRIIAADDGTSLDGLVNFPAGARVTLYPGGADMQLRHGVDVTATPGATPFETPDGAPYDLVATSNTPIVLERDVDLNVIRVIGGGVSGKKLADTVAAHASRVDNPHAVTKAQVGLGAVDDTSDADKPVSTAQQAALDLKAPLASPNFSGAPQKGGVNLATIDDVSAAIDGLDWQESVLDKDLSAAPVTPAAGDRYIIAAGASGAWNLRDLEIAEWNGAAWEFSTPTAGFATYVEDEGAGYVFNGAAWVKRDANDPNIMRLDRNETVTGDKNHTGALQKSGVDVATVADIAAVHDENATAIAANAATPDLTAKRIYITENTLPTTITNFIGGADGAARELHFGDDNTTVEDNANLKMPFGVNFQAKEFDVLICRKIAGVWRCK